MFSRLKQDKKFHIVDLEKLRESGRRGRQLKYYVKPVRNGRNALAKNIDFYVFLAAALIMFYLIAAAFTGSLAGALFYTAPVVIPGMFAAFKLRSIFEKEARAHMRFWREGRLCQERIKGLGNSGKLEELVAEILEKIPGFSDVHLLRESEENENCNMSTALRSLRRGLPVAVGSIMPAEGEGPVTSESVLKFVEELKSLNMEEGILVAAGTFSNEARRASREGNKKLTLVDLYRLVELSRITGHSIFPSSQQEAGAAQHRRENMYRKLLRYALMREKARGYCIAALIMFALYYMAASGGVKGLLYILFGFINLAMSLYCLIANKESDILGMGEGRQ